MDIQHSSHRKLFQAKHRDTAFYHLFEADDDLVSELTSFINSLFAPLTWILEETLYKRVHKQDKGWINIDFLHKNKQFQSIFKKFEIPSHCRRRTNFLNKAIEKSIIKRKRNFIKRKEHIKISQEAKKVVYIELKGIKSEKNNLIQQMRNVLTQKNLRNAISSSAGQILNMRQELQSPDKMQIEDQQNDKNQLNKMMSQIVFEGSLFKNEQEIQQKEMNKNKENIENEIAYRWCFIYFHFLEEQEVHRILPEIQNFLSPRNAPQKIQLEQEMDNLYLTENNINESSDSKKERHIKIYTLNQMIEQYYPKYNEVCQQIGHNHVDYRKQALKVRQKQREKEKVRLLESRYLDDKIDLVNKYHVKLDIEKQKRAYWEKRNKQIEERIRKRQQRRRNRMNRSEEPVKMKDLTQKLKELFDIDQPIKPQKKQTSFQSKPQFLNSNSMNTESIAENQQAESDINIHQAPGIKIKIPKFQYKNSPKQSFLNSHPQESIQSEEKKVQNDNLDELYADQINYEYDSLMSSGEEFELPKKKKRNRNSQSSKKHKKITKQTDHKTTTNENGKHSTSKNYKTLVNQQSSNRKPSKNESNSNGKYNLRHKSPSQGSYLKMAGYSYEETPSKNGHDQIYQDNGDEQKQEHPSGRNIRLRKRNEYYD